MSAQYGGPMRWLHVLALGFGLMVGLVSNAQEIAGYPRDVYAGDRREMALVPNYCMYTQTFRKSVPGGEDPRMINAWTARLGSTFHHLHHYCAGLIKVNRALLLVRDGAARNFYFLDAITEYDYVISRAPDDFVLLPEIVTKKGEVLVHLGKGQVAVLEFERAIELKADYWPPYAQLSDYHKTSGDLRKAREILDQGLARVPDAKPLLRRVAELDADQRRKRSP